MIMNCHLGQMTSRPPKSEQLSMSCMSDLPEAVWTMLAAGFCGPLDTGVYLLVIIDEHSSSPHSVLAAEPPSVRSGGNAGTRACTSTRDSALLGVSWTGQAPRERRWPNHPHRCLCPAGGAVDGTDKVRRGGCGRSDRVPGLGRDRAHRDDAPRGTPRASLVPRDFGKPSPVARISRVLKRGRGDALKKRFSLLRSLCTL
ncbi:hypothetical protein NDU88_003508 [Pleurodeles waltl]|uniref:Uncharacterized protein n=1 Tax=Pleurodeles waltl TaxID=8319 RepID=A0AAV7QD80_PLEWA|nr:hypothetical protein NDU88_003508 [Pleurodeles waltl]